MFYRPRPELAWTAKVIGWISRVYFWGFLTFPLWFLILICIQRWELATHHIQWPKLTPAALWMIRHPPADFVFVVIFLATFCGSAFFFRRVAIDIEAERPIPPKHVRGEKVMRDKQLLAIMAAIIYAGKSGGPRQESDAIGVARRVLDETTKV